jgi:hypothetical protein
VRPLLHLGDTPIDRERAHASEETRKAEVLTNRHFGIEGRKLGQEPDELAHAVGIRNAVDLADAEGATRRPEITREDPQQRGFPRPVQAEKADRLAGLNLETERTERALAAEVLGEFAATLGAPPPATAMPRPES